MVKNVTLFCNLPEDDPISLSLYAEQLKWSLASNQQNNFIIKVFRPKLNILPLFNCFPFLKKANNNLNKLRYHFIAKTINTAINHIIDQRYSHLIYSLDKNRTIVNCHDLLYFYYKYHPLSPLQKTIWRLEIDGLRRARKIIAVSDNTKRDIVKFLKVKEEKIVVIYNGIGKHFRKIDDRNILSGVKRLYNLDAGRYILHVGRNAPHKNVETVLKIIYILNNQFNLDTSLLKVGEEFTKEQHRLIESLKLKAKVTYIGKHKHSDMVLFYNVASLLLYPSFYEGFGWPPLEAMACGTPVVCSNSSSFPEVVGEGAVTADPSEIQSLSQKCYEILTNQKLATRSIIKGLKRVERFSWDKTAESVLKIYEEIII